jgi:hypothetical protein
MNPLKTYCLKCERPNMGCKCPDNSFTFDHSHKLRVPLTTKNKVVFRKFLKDCPTFVNCIPDELKPYFRDFLRKVKFFNVTINGREFTNINEKSKFETDLYTK